MSGTSGSKAAKSTKAARPTVLGVAVRDDTWFRRLDNGINLEPGAAAPDLLRIPVRDALRIMRVTVRFVADIPPRSSPDVVWVNGENELLVHTAQIKLACLSGLVLVALPVSCDQVPEAVTIELALGVGTAEAPSGLVMSTLNRPLGPDVIVDVWSGALIAFAWEGLVHLAQTLCAGVGNDADGRPLIPGYIAAARGELLIQPMARHRAQRRRP